MRVETAHCAAGSQAMCCAIQSGMGCAALEFRVARPIGLLALDRLSFLSAMGMLS